MKLEIKNIIIPLVKITKYSNYFVQIGLGHVQNMQKHAKLW